MNKIEKLRKNGEIYVKGTQPTVKKKEKQKTLVLPIVFKYKIKDKRVTFLFLLMSSSVCTVTRYCGMVFF
jgi:hypothetical protein